MKPTLTLGTRMSLVLTPALRHALHLLQLSHLDLQAEISNALDSNFLLEIDDPESAASLEADAGDRQTDGSAPGDRQATGDANFADADATPVQVEQDAPIPADMPIDADWRDVYDGDPGGSTARLDADTLNYSESNAHVAEDLRQHLEWQAQIAPFNDLELQVALAIVDAINDDGYLEDWDALCEQLLAVPGVDETCIDRVLEVVQGFEPSGVAARDIRECLQLQLRGLPAADRKRAEQLLEAPLELIAQRDIKALAHATGLSPHDVERALKLIKTLQPHPGRPWQADEPDYVEPDVIVEKHEGRWLVCLNPRLTVPLRITPLYHNLLNRAKTAHDRQTLKKHHEQAASLIRGLKSRGETLLRVTHHLVEVQRGYLEHGAEAMRPLVLRTVADALELHASTVSRAIANKYLLAPHGLLALKRFFSSHVETSTGGTCSATAVQAMIHRLVKNEDPAHPLSDDDLSRLLRAEGIKVARRTVAKYREQSSIPASHARRARAAHGHPPSTRRSGH